MLTILSTLVLILIFFGVMNARKTRIHIPVMTVAFLVDLALVLYIELNRGAIEQAVEGVGGLLLFHILVSTMVLVLYIVLIALGLRVYRDKPQLIVWHRRLAYLFIVGRLVNYVTSFYIV